ncbi:nucleotidyltransferase family protein [Albimonas sp. CAU 1670]|uniref:nucleotidyltransferase family protein n=1 Tax=Albimonas sp. CAU 1670 TaxID=3032599 RepID=UPI0023DBF058|nr:nucleotidyltransferase family protein [Albimonas sp. CAU 1670]MDF2235538.1 nucleotidyltransferase family protein [Albimonas sp. CAU 1670]
MTAPDPAPPARAPGPLVVAETLALLRAWETGATPPAPKARALDLVAFASDNGVAWAVCDALSRRLPPPVAQLLLRPAMAPREAVAERMAAQLRDLAALLSAAGVEATALKGAATVVAAGGAPAPWREMTDIDLLTDEADLPRAVQALLDAGYTGDVEAYVATDYHFPALYPPPGRGVATVELHARTGWSHGGPLRDLGARALPSALPGLRVPTAEDRLIHLVQHSQVADRRHHRRSVRLRDALDWRLLTRADPAAPGGPADPEAAAARLAPGLPRKAFKSFATLMARVWETPAPARWEARHGAWAEQTLAALADPALAERWREQDRRRAAWDAVTSRETLAHLVAGSLNAARLRRFLRRV